MASTGTALYPGSTTFPGSSTFPGQGTQPLARIRLSTDDASAAIPAWTDVTSDVRSFSVSRGRDTELSEFDAGSCTIVLDNRDRAYDPNNNAAIKPLNRWWIEERFSGESHDLFKGYAESYDNQWPGGGFDAECAVSCVEEMKVLTWLAMPGFSPQRSSYAEVIASDLPISYWRLNEDPVVNVQPAQDVKPPPVAPNPPPKATWPYFGRPSFGYRPP